MSNLDTTPLFDTIKTKDIVECRKLIEFEGANIHDKDCDDRSPITWASYHGHVSVVELLLPKGANIHDEDIEGYSSILAASVHDHISVVDLLLSKGASLYDTNNHGMTCFTLARHPIYIPYPYRKHGLLCRRRKWPTTMAIIVLTELALI